MYVNGLGLRMELCAGEPGLEVREFPVSLREGGAGKQWRGCLPRILLMEEVTVGMAKMHLSLVPIVSQRCTSLLLNISELTWTGRLKAM